MPARTNDKIKSTPRSRTDQYHHFIPRFILRRFQVGTVRSKAERRREFRKTGIDPEYVLYYDIAPGTLDARPIGKVYGALNLYGDKRNQENVNELEEKLSGLECEAASIIRDLHAALPAGKFCLKRRPLETLRKFLFLMHYRHAIVAPVYFQEDHAENAQARQWIEHFKKSKGLETAVDVWLYMLRFYLDNSHSQLMILAAQIISKYGADTIFNCASKSPIPPEIEHLPVTEYQTLAGAFFMCIWEAADGDEFPLTHDGFGLGEGYVLVNGQFGGRPSLHRIFVLGPRVVLVLRSVALRPENVGDFGVPMLSDLLHIPQSPPETTYAGGTSWLESNTLSDMENYRASKQAEEDLFTFSITKLSRSQTMAVNNVLLRHVASNTSLTFLSKDCMLRTARSFCSGVLNMSEAGKFTKLIKMLSLDLPVSNKAGEVEDGPFKFVDIELFKLLMDISTGAKTFASAYDRAKAILAIVEGKRYTASEFGYEHHMQVTTTYDTFRRDCEVICPDLEEIQMATLLETISANTSASVFKFIVPIMQASGFTWARTANVLDTLQAEVAVVGFLQRLSRSPSGWYKVNTTNKDAASLLSRLFHEGPFDSFVALWLAFARSRSEVFGSNYNKAHTLHRLIFFTGPTTSSFSSYCASCIAVATRGFSLLPATSGDVRPQARLAQKLTQAQWIPVVSMIKDIMTRRGYDFSAGQGDTSRAELRRIADDVIIIGVVGWLAKNRFNMLHGFCRSRDIPLIEVGRSRAS
ncbi:hypothetical protein PAXRUDRAFT_830650 [Paxillus rubicundulus Ve08.2h10]|uniref:DUF4238 domain-containing protein n=1 Tax=Paxillus rubicundulus Ve08.2h10 TaxID=930991 RepID=A0A0D0D4Z3_9AGAM|nr:hypothetical protein PAXRUDRAFT_830650 [Paxillus rubicundulus Ve08.2h10]